MADACAFCLDVARREKAPPAFQFYARDWLADLRVRELSWPQRGMYVELLMLAWNEGGALPSDPRRLAKILGLSGRAVKLLDGLIPIRMPRSESQLGHSNAGVGRRITVFECCECGASIRHPRLERERRNQLERSEKARKAADARHHPEASSDDADALRTQCTASSSASASSLKRNDDLPHALPHTHTPETLAGARERDPLAEEPEVCVSEDPDRKVSASAQRIATPSARRPPAPVVVATSTAVVIDGQAYDERLGFPPPPDPGEAELSAARAEVRALYVSLWQAQNPRTNVSLAWRPADDVALANLTSDPSVLAAALPMVRYAFQARAPAFIWKDGRTPIFSRIAANLSQCVPPDASLVGSEPLAPKPGTHHVMSFFSQLGMQPEKVALNA